MVVVEASWYDELEKRVKHQETFFEKMKEVRNADQDNENDLKGLDSALKKTTSFIKKIKNLTSATIPSIIEDLKKLNLSKFVEEMASGITETKLKLSDIPKVSELCVEISARYSSFSEALVAEFRKMLPLKKTDKISNVAKLKINILFLADLVLCGVFNEKDGLQILGGVLSYLVQTDKTDFNNVSLISAICRHSGWQIAQVVQLPADASETKQITEMPKSSALTSAQKKSLRDLMIGYYDALLKITETLCVVRNKALKKVKKQERVRGDAGDTEKNELDSAQNMFDEKKKMAIELSCALGIEMKEMKEEASDDEEDAAANQEMGRALAEGEIVLWTDEETRAFYENLINLREVVPKSLYKESEQKTIEKTNMVQNIDDIDVENINENGAADTFQNQSAMVKNVVEEIVKTETRERSPTFTDNSGQNQWQSFVLDLDHLVSKYSVDQAAISFVSNFNKKGNHKKLIKLMVNPPASRLDLIPFYARLIAILENVMPDVTIEIVNQTLEKFRGYLQKSGENERVETKMVTVAMIAELMKFNVISRAEGLSCLRQLVYNLRGHAVDMTATMIEMGGYFLYRHTDSHSKMKRLLEVVKVKRERMKDSRQIMLIDNAYFTCLPPEESEEIRSRLKNNSEDTPIKQFIRHLIVDIDVHHVDIFLKCLRRLDWSDPDISNYAIKYMSSPWLVPLENLQHLSSAIVGLCSLSHLKWIGIAVIDNLIETIKISMEFPESFNQWANSAINYLGELYNFALCEEDVILKVLYLLITFPENDQSMSWRDLSRLRLVCSLLQVAGEFLKTSAVANKFRYFMIYFDRFYFMKKDRFESEVEKLGQMGAIEDIESSITTRFPFEIEIAYENCSKVLKRVKSAIPANLEAANQAVERMETNLKKTLSVEQQAQQNPDNSRRGSFDETTIFEEDEDEYSDEDEEESDYDEEEEKLRFSEELRRQATKEEEDDFQRELDSLMGDGYRNPTTGQNVHEMSLPAAAKNRFERRIMFADDTKEESSSTSVGGLISMAHNEEIIVDEDDEERQRRKQEKNNRVTLMMRGKGSKPHLKTVSIEDETLRERWEQEKEREKKEREDMKQLTLGQHRRIEMEEEKAQLAQMMNYRIRGGSKKKI